MISLGSSSYPKRQAEKKGRSKAGKTRVQPSPLDDQVKQFELEYKHYAPDQAATLAAEIKTLPGLDHLNVRYLAAAKYLNSEPGLTIPQMIDDYSPRWAIVLARLNPEHKYELGRIKVQLGIYLAYLAKYRI